MAEASALASRILVRLGAEPAHAALQADLWLAAELSGLPSHGLLRLPTLTARIRVGLVDPAASGHHTWRGEAFLHVDGRQGLGPVVAAKALDALMARTARTGAAVGAVAGANHLGMLAWYAERVAARGFVLLATTTSEALVHPWGGRTAMVGTNPIAIGVPADPDPLVLDMSTGLISMGKVKDHANRRLPLEAGWAVDADGEPTLDPVAAQAGAIAPFGGAKGYGLGLALEVLVACLTATALGTDVTGTLDAVHPATKGDVFVVVDARATAMAGPIGAYLDAVRGSPAADPAVPVRVPGDRARVQRERARTEGIDVAADLWDQLTILDQET